MALGNEHSRNEFLKALLSQKKELNANGGNLVNPAVNINPIDDNNSRVVDTSYIDPLASRTVTQEEKYKESRNGWQRFWDTVGNFVSNINEGIAKYILDPIGDAGIYLYGAISGDHEGAKAAMNYDWTAQYMNVMNQLDIGTNIMSGDFFGADGGDYWRDWADTGNAQASRTNINKLHEASFSSDWGDFGQGVQKVEQGVGYILPSLVLAYFTGGSSLGAQAAIQGGVIGAAAMGGGVETALKEGATYGQAMGYGATKGIISGGITAATIGIGGSVLGQSASGAVGKLSGTVGSKVGQLTGSKGAEVFAAKATEALVRAGFSATNAFAQSMADPALKAIYDGGDAIAQAYGDNEKVKQTMMRAGNAALMSGATSLAVSAIREGGELAIRGRDGYMADYYSKQAALQQKALEKEIKSLNSDIEKGKNVDIEARMAKINKINGLT